MGGLQTTQTGSVEVVVHEGGILERRGRGFVTHAHLAAAHAQCDRLMKERDDITLLLTDMLAVEGFESGLPIASLRWVQVHGDRWRAAAIVIRSPALAGIAQSFESLIPDVPHLVTQSRDEAWEFLRHPPDANRSSKRPARRA